MRSIGLKYVMLAASVIVSKVETIEEGETRTQTELESREFSLANLPAVFADGDKEKSLAVYGLTKWLQDRTSSAANTDEKFSEMAKYFTECLEKGLWKAPSVAKEKTSKASIDTYVVQALAELKGISLAVAMATLQKATKEVRDAVIANPKIAQKVAELKLADAETAEEVGEVDLTDFA